MSDVKDEVPDICTQVYTKFHCQKVGDGGMTTLGTYCYSFMLRNISLMSRPLQGAEVFVRGDIWDEANEAALECLQDNPQAAFVHPYDHPLIWYDYLHTG